MQYGKIIELIWRGYAREHRSIEDTFLGVTDSLAAVCLGCQVLDPDKNIEIGEPITEYLPIRESDLARSKERGILVIERANGHVVVIRQWEIIIRFDAEDELLEWAEAILAQMPNTFTNMRLVKDVFTDVPPA